MTPIDVSEEAGVRYLHFGSEWVQGAMRIRRPYDLELAYTREMMAGLLMRGWENWPRTVLLIGLGAASLAKFCYWKLPHARSTVIEIEPAVLACAQQFFKLPRQSERFEVLIADGFDYITQAQSQWDLILVDGFDRHARAGRLDSKEFYSACKARLSGQGLIAVNLFGRSRKFNASVKRIAETFEDRCITFPSCDSGNVIAFAAQGEAIEVSFAELRERAKRLREQTGLNLLPTVARLQKSRALQHDSLPL